MSRTDVAVGTSRERSMFLAIALAMPFISVAPDSGRSPPAFIGEAAAFFAAAAAASELAAADAGPGWRTFFAGAGCAALGAAADVSLVS